MERRLHHPTLPQVLFVLAGEQAVAEQDLGLVQSAALVQVAGVLAMHVLDDFGAVERVEVTAEYRPVGDLRVAPSQFGEVLRRKVALDGLFHHEHRAVGTIGSSDVPGLPRLVRLYRLARHLPTGLRVVTLPIADDANAYRHSLHLNLCTSPRSVTPR